MKRSDFGKLSLMGLGLLGVKVEENGYIFQVLCRVWFSQSTTRVGCFVKNLKDLVINLI